MCICVCVYTLYFFKHTFFRKCIFCNILTDENCASLGALELECSRSVCQTTQQFAPTTTTRVQTHTHTHRYTLVCWCMYVHRMCTYARGRDCIRIESKKTLICVQVNYQAAAPCCCCCCCCLYANMAASKYETILKWLAPWCPPTIHSYI